MYFYKIHAQANANNEITFFMALNGYTQPPEHEPKFELTVETLKENEVYKSFLKKSFKRVMVEYTVYKTDVEIAPVHYDEHLDELNIEASAPLYYV